MELEYNIFNYVLNAIITTYVMYQLLKDTRKIRIVQMIVPTLGVGVSAAYISLYSKFWIIPLNTLVMYFIFVTLYCFFWKTDFLTTLFSALVVVVFTAFCEIACFTIYILPQGLSMDEYRTNYFHILMGNLIAYIFFYILTKIFAKIIIRFRNYLLSGMGRKILGILFEFLLFFLWILSITMIYQTMSEEGNIIKSDSMNKIIVCLAVIGISSMLVFYRLLFHGERYIAIYNSSRKDAFLGILNRQAGLEMLEILLTKYREKGEQFILCYMDINGLKKINDTFGHSEGDQLIKGVTETVKQFIYKRDIFARIGGDEFIILFPRASKEMIENKMQKIQTQLIENKAGENWGIPSTFSFGLIDVADFSREELPEGKEIMALADEKMYLHKKEMKKKDVAFV